MTNTTEAGLKLEVVEATDAHCDALSVFFREAWGADGTAESVREARRLASEHNTVEPGRHPPTFVVLRAGRVVGYCSSLPNRLWDGHEERGAYWAKGLMVVPEYRNGPIGFLVLKMLTKALKIGTSVTVAPASKRLFAALGYLDHGAAANLLLPLSLGRIASRVDTEQLASGGLPPALLRSVATAQRLGVARLGGTLAGAGLTLVQAARGRTRLQVALDSPFPTDELDALWSRCRVELRAAPVRDSRAWGSRYAAAQGLSYRFATVREAGDLVGVAVIRVPGETGDPRLKGLRVVSFSDALFQPSRAEVARAVITAARLQARRLQADALLCTATHRAFVTALRGQGYIPVGGNIHFFIRDPERVGQWPPDLGDWWLTRGDGHSDESF